MTRCTLSSFVAKSGPIFVAQDAAEAVLRWEDGSKTVFFGVIWAFLCECCLSCCSRTRLTLLSMAGWYPLLLLLLPNVVLASILLYTYQARALPTSPDSPNPGPAPAAPVEGSVE